MTKKVAIAAFAILQAIFFSHQALADENPFERKAQSAAPKLSGPKDYYARALNEFNAKDYHAAIRDYSEAIRLNPHYGEAIANRGASRFNVQDFDGAIEDYNQALKIFPTNKAILDLKAQAENSIKARDEQAQARAAAARNALNAQMMMGGDLSDPATIIMMNAKRRGLIPQNTPNP